MNRVGVIGHFGFGLDLSNGQTIKTKIVTTGLERYCKEKVVTVDTHGGIKMIIPIVIRVINLLRTCKNVIVMLTENGLKVCVPILCVFNRLFKRKLHYVVIGGWLPEYLLNHKTIKQGLKRFDGIYVETEHMRKTLKKMGFNNVFRMPNCKYLHIIDDNNEPEFPYKLCTFSRVMKEKGIMDAVDAVKQVNTLNNEVVCGLDIYGPIEPNQKEWFQSLMQSFPSYIKYCGVIPFDKSSEILKKYYCMLFPTYYSGEGFPGTAIDAFSAGIPVVASNWKYNEEIIHNGETGLIFQVQDLDSLVKRISELLEHPEFRKEMHHRCIEEAKKYQPDSVLQTLFVNLS